MALTPEQTAAISAELSVDLATATDDRLIELCLLYRSAPEALPTFPDLLEVEITRRFTAAEIAANDIMFSVIQNFSNQFSPELQYKEKLYQFVNALDREVWIAGNVSFFEATLTVPSRVEWLLNDSVVFDAVLESPLASNKLSNSSVAMNAVAASSTAMNAVAASSAAMNAVAASSTAMNAVAASSAALAVIVVSTPARNALMNNNAILQSVRHSIYNTVIANWTKNKFFSHTENSPSANAAIASPVAFVFALMTKFDSSDTYTNILNHPNNMRAYLATRASDYVVHTALTALDVVSFNGAKFVGTPAGCYSYIELWTPPA